MLLENQVSIENNSSERVKTKCKVKVSLTVPVTLKSCRKLLSKNRSNFKSLFHYYYIR